MRQLNKKLLRDMLVRKTQVIAVVIIVILGTLVMATLLLAPRTLQDQVHSIMRRTNYESFSVRVAAAPHAMAAAVRRVPGASAVTGRTEQQSLAAVAGKQLTVRVVSLPDTGQPSVNGVLIDSGTLPPPGSLDTCLVERHLAKQFKVGPRATVTLLRDGVRVPLTVTGAATSPEYLRLVTGMDVTLTDPSQFGVVFMRRSGVDALFGTAGTDNSFVATVRPGVAVQPALRAAGLVLAPYHVVGAASGDDEPGISGIEMDLKNLQGSALFFAFIFLCVSALTIYIAISRMVYTERKQIGTAKAIGYSGHSLLAHYLSFGLAMGLCGGALGAALGVVSSRMLVGRYASVLGLPPPAGLAAPWDIMAGAVLLAVLLCLAGAAMPALLSSRMQPAAAIRLEAGLSLGTGGEAHRKPLTGRLPAWLGFPLRNLSRSRRRTALTLVGLAVAVGTLLTVNSALYSIDHMMNKQYSQVFGWNVAAYFTEPQQPGLLATVRAIPGVSGAEPVISLPAILVSGTRSQDVQLLAYQRETTMHESFPVDDSPAQASPGGILLNNAVRKSLPLSRGQRVTVSTALGTMPVTVDGFVAEPFGGIGYMNQAYLQRLAGGPVFNAVALTVVPGTESAVAVALRRLPGADRVESKSASMVAMHQAMNGLTPIFDFLFVMVLCIGVAITFTFITINMLERRQEFATMLTLGAGTRRLTGFMLVETLSIGLLVAVPAILLGWLFAWLLFTKVMNARLLNVELNSSPWQIAVILVGVLALMSVAVVISIRRLPRMDLAAETRERAG